MRLSPVDAEQVLTKAEQDLIVRANAALPPRSRTRDWAYLSFLDLKSEDHAKDLVTFDLDAWMLFESFDFTGSMDQSGSWSGMGDLTRMALAHQELAFIRMSRYDLAQRQASVVKGPIAGKAKVARLPDGHFLLFHADSAWQWYCNLGVGLLPKRVTGCDEVISAVKANDRNATLVSKSMEMGLNGLVILNQYYLQVLKHYAPQAFRFLHELPAALREPLRRACLQMLDWADQPSSRLFGTRGGVGRVQYDRFVAAMRISGAWDVLPYLRGPKVSRRHLPLIHDDGEYVYFSPAIVRTVGYWNETYRMHGDKQGHKLAADVFELIVEDVLRGQGYQTRVGTQPLVSVMLSKKNPHEIDVIAVGQDEILLIECKMHGVPPGAWTPDMVAKRVGELQGWQDDLTDKAAIWRTRLGTDIKCRTGGKEVTIPADWTAGKKIRTFVVSARVEPRTNHADTPVITYATPPVKRVWMRALPIADLAPLWSDADRL